MKPSYELSIEYNRTYISKKKVYLVFNTNIVNFEDSKVDKEDLKKKLESKLPDNKYFKIHNFSMKDVTYEFDLEKWFKKSITETIIDTADRFEKKIKMAKLPEIILNNVNQVVVEKLINETFRNYIEKNSKIKKAVLESMTCVTKACLSYFHFEYDSYFGTINISLRPEFRTNPILLFKADNLNKPKKEVKKMGFDKSVYTLLKVNTSKNNRKKR